MLLISCYELGHQPMGLAAPLGRFPGAETLDLSIEPFDEAKIARADRILISVPMHTALRLGVQVARRIRQINPAVPITFHGLYAVLNREYLSQFGDAILGDWGRPERTGLQPLDRYARLNDGRVVGYVEATRGCLHLCRHCPIPPVYNGRLDVVPVDIVLEDIRRQVAAGATHITFGDPDFLNGPGHSMRIVRAMPRVTFNFTAKVEHLLKRRSLLPELAERGCLFITSAVESLSDVVLEELQKGHTGADVRECLRIVRETGIALHPTFVPFTPWTTLEDYRDILRFVEETVVDPVQLSIRLLIPPGSLLLGRVQTLPLEPEKLYYPWVHPDPAMDDLCRRVMEAVPEGYEKICALAGVTPRGVRRDVDVPRLTESWYC